MPRRRDYEDEIRGVSPRPYMYEQGGGRLEQWGRNVPASSGWAPVSDWPRGQRANLTPFVAEREMPNLDRKSTEVDPSAMPSKAKSSQSSSAELSSREFVASDKSCEPLRQVDIKNKLSDSKDAQGFSGESSCSSVVTDTVGNSGIAGGSGGTASGGDTARHEPALNAKYSSNKLDILKLEAKYGGGANFSCTRFRWVDDMDARHSIIIALTAFYAMVLTIFALVFELSRLLSGESRRDVGYKDLFFGVYMYGTSITFLVYCYVVLLLNPRWRQNLERAKQIIYERRIRRKKLAASALSSLPPVKPQKPEFYGGAQIFQDHSTSSFSHDFGSQLSSQQYRQNMPSQTSLTRFDSSIQFGSSINSSDSQSMEVGFSRRVSHDSPSAGSLFLRLGCIVFGVIGMVYYAFSAYLCASDIHCYGMVIFLDALAILFVFTQMHFVFCNWKLSITGSQILARFGTMHLIAANLWTWIRYILLEESAMNDEIRQVFTRDATIVGPDMKTPLNRTTMPTCQGAECVLASMSEVMYTSIVEYSLISAGVMLIVWRNIDFERKVVVYVKRKHQIRINCSKTTNGLFLGLAYLAGTFTIMAIFSGYTLMGQNRLAAMVFGCSDITQYSLASLGCLLALWQMRQLHFNSPHSSSSSPPSSSEEYSSSTSRIIGNMMSASADSSTASAVSSANTADATAATAAAKSKNHHSQELLDIILLGFGMTGEMIYSVAGLLGLSAYDKWETLSTILLLVHVTRISQVGLQSCLIYIAGKLSVQGDEVLRRTQPGKQAITFLLLANISMFLMNLLEAEKAGVSDAVVDFYGRRSWVFLVRSFSPLTIFYRFHSSVCLAEVWKTTYSSKE